MQFNKAWNFKLIFFININSLVLPVNGNKSGCFLWNTTKERKKCVASDFNNNKSSTRESNFCAVKSKIFLSILCQFKASKMLQHFMTKWKVYWQNFLFKNWFKLVFLLFWWVSIWIHRNSCCWCHFCHNYKCFSREVVNLFFMRHSDVDAVYILAIWEIFVMQKYFLHSTFIAAHEDSTTI